MTALLSTLLAQESSGSPLGLLIIVIPMAAILYMTIVPQRKARQRQAEMLRKLDVGDEVLTTGGIVGTITFVEDELYHLEVDNDVVIRIAKTAVARSTAEPDPAEKPASRSRGGLLGGLTGASAASKDDAGETDDGPAGDDAVEGDAAGDTADSKGADKG